MQYGFPQHVKSKALSALTTELPLAWDDTVQSGTYKHFGENP